MSRSFKCVSCGAPLNFTGEVIQKCAHCGSSVTAPGEMFYANNPHPFADISMASERSRRVASVLQLIHHGKHDEAVTSYMNSFGATREEAQLAVNRIEQGKVLDLTGVKVFEPLAIKLDSQVVKTAGVAGGTLITAAILVPVLIAIGGLAIGLFVTMRSPDISQIANTAASITPTPAGPTSKGAQGSSGEEVLKFGGKGSGPGLFEDNRHVAIDRSNGRIFSSNYSPARVQVFDGEGNFLSEWKPVEGSYLYGLASDGKGSVYVATNKGIYKHDSITGEISARVERFSGRGMTVTRSGSVVVCDENSIVFFDSSLKEVRKIADARERASARTGFYAIAADGNDELYLLDRGNDNIVKFGADGKYLTRIPTGARSPNAIAVAPTGEIYLSDTSSIRVFSSEGQRLTDFRTTQAFGMAITSEGELVVATRPFITKFVVTL